MSAPDALRFDVSAEHNTAATSLRKTWSRRSIQSRDGMTLAATEKEIDESLFGADDGPNVRESDFKHKQV
jgi:hypothetical protein